MRITEEDCKKIVSDLILSKYTNLDVKLVLAIIWQESSYNTHAFRYETAFYDKYVKPLSHEQICVYNPEAGSECSIKTEKVGMATSWGLMQIMGLKARELGFRGDFLTELTVAETNIDLGMELLSQLKTKYVEQRKYISAYNAGSPSDHNTKYVDEVLDKINNIS